MSGAAPRALALPLTDDSVGALRAGDEVSLTGALITGRDRACARLYRLLQEGKSVPVELSDELMYFVGPAPAPPGMPIGAAGPTTSGRMNPFVPALLNAGLRGILGKGFVDTEVKRALEQRPGVYLGAIGGTGALLARSITHAEVVAFPELGSEAMFRLRLADFPAVVLHDCHGGDLYARTYGEASVTASATARARATGADAGE